MTLGVISDIHGNPYALAAVLDEFGCRGVSQLLFLGDLVGYYPFAKACVGLLARWPMLAAVRGNHDQVALDCLRAGRGPAPEYRKAYGSALERTLNENDAATGEWLTSLPLESRIIVQGRTLHLCHGSPWDPLEGRVYPDADGWERFEGLGADAVLMGHTHYPMLRRPGDVLVFNPGAVGQARQRSGVACAGLLDVPSLAATLIEIPYDAAPLIEDAQIHDPDLPYLVHVLRR